MCAVQLVTAATQALDTSCSKYQQVPATARHDDSHEHHNDQYGSGHDDPHQVTVRGKPTSGSGGVHS